MTAQTARLLVDGNGQIIPNQYYDVATNSFIAGAGGTGISVGVTEVSSSNPLPVAQTDGLAVSGTATSAAVLFTTSMLNYESITVQVTSAGTNCVIVYEQSEDQTIWYSVSGISVTNFGPPAPSSATTAAAMNIFPRKGTYFRARVVTYGSGTVAVTGALSKTPVNLTIEARLSGYANEGAAITNQPVPIALEGRTSSKTSVTSGQAVRPISTVDGRQIVRLDAIPENEWSYVAASGGITNTTTAVTLAAGAGSGVRNYITSLQVSSDTLGTATEVVIRDGVGGAVLWRTKIGTAGTVGIQDIRFHPPLRGASNTLLEAACVTATGTGSIYLNVQGY